MMRMRLPSLTVDTAFYGSFLLLLAMQFAITVPAPHTIWFYGVVLPVTGLWLWRNQPIMKTLWENHSLRWFMVFLGYLIIHALGWMDVLGDTSKTVRNTLATATFLCAATLFFSQLERERWQTLCVSIALVAGLCAAISLLLYDPQAEMRLRPIGRADTQVLGAFVYTMGAIFGLAAMEDCRSQKQGLALAASVFLCLLVVLCTQSRMALVVLLLAMALGALYHCRHSPRRLLMLLGVGAAVAGIAAALLHDDISAYIQTLIERGDSFRLALWERTIARILEAPWQGHGMLARIDFSYHDYVIHSPHNIYLTTALAAGVPAMVLLLMAISHLLLSGMVRLSLRSPRVFFTALLIVSALASGMIDHSRIVKGPSPLWMIFWLPLAMGIAELIRHEERQRKTKD
jgi:O-antigen ligase